MKSLRTFLRHRSTLALWLVVAALFVRAAVPQGYMLDAGSDTLTLTICSDASGTMKTHDVTVPGDGKGTSTKSDSPCAFAGLTHAMIGGADAALLAAALLYILTLGFAAKALPPITGAHYLRPPLRGPPATL